MLLRKIKLSKDLYLLKREANAFTLVEVLVAMLVLAIGLLGLAGMTVVVLRSNVLSQQISEATTITSDLMESIKLQAYSALPDCPASTAAPVSTNSGCDILMQSGVNALGADWLPIGSVSLGCSIANVVTNFADGTTATYDTITANLLAFNAIAPLSATSFCSDFNNLPRGRYVRYYRTFNPNAGGSPNERTINTVVLWKDRFNKWRHLRLATTRSGG